MEENKKSKLGLGILIGLLIALVIGLTGFIIYDKVLVDDEDNKQVVNSDTTNNAEKEENDSVNDSLVDISSSELKIILEKINVYDSRFSVSYPIKDFISFSKNMSNQDKLSFLYSNLSDYSYGQSFSKNDLGEVASKYFYDSFSYKDENIICNLGHNFYNYDSNTKIYTSDNEHPGHGGEGFGRDKFYFVNGFYDDKNNEYIVNGKILYGDYCPDICGPIQEYYDSNNRKNVIYKNNDGEISDDEVYELVKDKLPITTYKFIKNSSNEIVLKSVTTK